MASPRMPFGKYKGQRLSDIDTGYLGIVFDKSVAWGVSPELRAAIVAELLHRIAPGARRPTVGDDEPRPTGKKVFDPHGIFDQAGPSAYEPRPTPIRTNTTEMPRMLREIVDMGFKHLARKYHPDAGGNHEDMTLLTRAVEALRKAIPK